MFGQLKLLCLSTCSWEEMEQWLFAPHKWTSRDHSSSQSVNDQWLAVPAYPSMLCTTAYSSDQMVLIYVPPLYMQFLVHVPSCCHNSFHSQNCPLKVQGSKYQYHIDVWKVSRLSCIWEEMSQWVFTLHHRPPARDHLLHCQQKPMNHKVNTSSLHTNYTQQTIYWCTCDNFDFALHATLCTYTFLLSQQFPFPKLPFEGIYKAGSIVHQCDIFESVLLTR